MFILPGFSHYLGLSSSRHHSFSGRVLKEGIKSRNYKVISNVYQN